VTSDPSPHEVPVYVPKRSAKLEPPPIGHPCESCGSPRLTLTYDQNARLVCSDCRPDLTHLDIPQR
jgi:hypothetical protein